MARFNTYGMHFIRWRGADYDDLKMYDALFDKQQEEKRAKSYNARSSKDGIPHSKDETRTLKNIESNRQIFRDAMDKQKRKMKEEKQTKPTEKLVKDNHTEVSKPSIPKVDSQTTPEQTAPFEISKDFLVNEINETVSTNLVFFSLKNKVDLWTIIQDAEKAMIDDKRVQPLLPDSPNRMAASYCKSAFVSIISKGLKCNPLELFEDHSLLQKELTADILKFVKEKQLKWELDDDYDLDPDNISFFIRDFDVHYGLSKEKCLDPFSRYIIDEMHTCTKQRSMDLYIQKQTASGKTIYSLSFGDSLIFMWEPKNLSRQKLLGRNAFIVPYGTFGEEESGPLADCFEDIYSNYYFSFDEKVMLGMAEEYHFEGTDFELTNDLFDYIYSPDFDASQEIFIRYKVRPYEHLSDVRKNISKIISTLAEAGLPREKINGTIVYDDDWLKFVKLKSGIQL